VGAFSEERRTGRIIEQGRLATPQYSAGWDLIPLRAKCCQVLASQSLLAVFPPVAPVLAVVLFVDFMLMGMAPTTAPQPVQ
jgi:hypothetical protein